MIFLTKDGLEDNKSFKEIIKKEEQMIVMMIESQNIKSNILSDSMQRFADYADTDLEKVDDKMDSIIFFLNNFKNTLALSKTNIYLLNNVLDSIKKIEEIFTKDDEKKTEKIEEYNNNFIETNEIVLANTIQIEQTLNHILSFSEFAFDSKNKLNKLITNIENKTLDIEPNLHSRRKYKEELNSIPIDESLINEMDLEERPEKTLIVSEKEEIVILPFTLKELNKIFVESKGKYEDFNEIIDEKFTLPLNRFKNTSMARFREAFKLMRRKEKESLKKSFELGMELFFNYNLHPAIITACKSLDELDIYLDYLDANETEKFDCFKIIFHIAPVEIKSNKFNVFINKVKKIIEKDEKEPKIIEETLDNNEINSDIEKIILSTEKENANDDVVEDEYKEEFFETLNLENNENETKIETEEMPTLENEIKMKIEELTLENEPKENSEVLEKKLNKDYEIEENIEANTNLESNLEEQKEKVNELVENIEIENKDEDENQKKSKKSTSKKSTTPKTTSSKSTTKKGNRKKSKTS